MGGDPARVWAVLVPLLAGRPRVRESRDGGRSYQARWERPLTSRLPAVPAAVPLYSGAGDTRVLVIDLDVSRGGVAAVRRDAAALTALIGRCGGRVIRDCSPPGGVHLYVPLAVPVAFHEARDVALALACRTPSMDATPNVNLQAGLIRPPGSPHKTGGHQQLSGSLAAAHQLATVGNPPAVWSALTAALAPELAAAARRTPTGAEEDAAPAARAGGPRELTGAYLQIATTGVYDTGRYRSPSEARQAVLCSAAAAGLTLPQVLGRLARGVWPGLASFYARYRNPDTRRKALVADWRNAVAFISRKPPTRGGGEPVPKCHTSQPPSHPPAPGPARPATRRGSPGEYQFLNSWWTALRLVEVGRYTGRGGPAVRMVLRAIGEAAGKTGSRYVAFGTRSLSIAAGLDHGTVAAHLRLLRGEDDPLIVLIEADRGLGGDLYELRIPDQVALQAQRRAWRPGKPHALRPAFRALGLPAAYAYEALENTAAGASSFQVAEAAGLGRATAYRALETLGAFGLAQQRGGRWHLEAAASLAELAERLGCIREIELTLARHRADRAAWRALLGAVPDPPAAPVTGGGRWPGAPPEPPPRDAETALELLERVLGARRIPEPA